MTINYQHPDDVAPVTARDVVEHVNARTAEYEEHRLEQQDLRERNRVANLRRVNRMLVVLFIGLVVAVGYLAVRSELTTNEIKDGLYGACQTRASQIRAYDSGKGRKIVADIVLSSNPGMTEKQRSELMNALANELQFPVPTCVRN